MANRTARDATTIKGTNPQYIIEKIIRHRIYDSLYWKEHCFGLTGELLVDKGVELRYVGGIYGGNVKPTPFLCLILKMLQIQPDKEIIIEFIRQEDYKYIRALGAVYFRLILNSVEIYKYLEPLFNDYRKLRYMNQQGRFELVYMDELIDRLLRDERVFDIQLPRLQKRQALEDVKELEPYRSILDEDLDALSASDSDDDRKDRKKEKPRLLSKRRASRERDRGDRDRERDRGDREKAKDDRDRDHRDRERDTDRERGDRGRDRGDRGDRRERTPPRHHDRHDRGERDRGGGDRHNRDRSRERDSRRDRGDRDDRNKSRRDDGGRSKGKSGGDELSIDETNAMRAKLGLAPLEQ